MLDVTETMVGGVVGMSSRLGTIGHNPCCSRRRGRDQEQDMTRGRSADEDEVMREKDTGMRQEVIQIDTPLPCTYVLAC